MERDYIHPTLYRPRPLPTVRDVAAVLFRQRKVMLTVFSVIVLAVLVSGLWVPKYEAHMKILVRRQRIDAIVTPQANTTPQYNGIDVSEEDLNSEVELLNSNDLLRKVVVATGLQKTHAFTFLRHVDDNTRIESAEKQLAKTLTIEPVRKTNVIAISYKSRDPQQAAKVLNALATAYTEKHLEVHRPSGEFGFFDQQTQQYRAGLEQAQHELTKFSAQSGVVSADKERDLALQRVDEFNAEARQAQTDLDESAKRIRSLQKQLAVVSPRIATTQKAAENQQLMEQLKATLLQLQLQRTDLLTKYDPHYRLVQEVDSKIAETQAAISSEEAKPAREETTDKNPDYQWIESELTKARAQASGLKARATAALSVAGRYQEIARGLNQNGVVQENLERTARMEEENYLLYVRKREEARISDALDQRRILNVALAEQPVVPALPNRSPLNTAALSLLFAFAVSVSSAFVADLVDPSFRTPDELAGYLDIPVLAALPKGEI